MTEVWAVAHGDRSKKQHLVLEEQLLTQQAPKCGTSIARSYWMSADTKVRWTKLPRCEKCSSKESLP